MAQKYYVVWAGRRTGVFDNWPATLASVDKFAGAKYKSFATRAEAEQAFSDSSSTHIVRKTSSGATASKSDSAAHVAHQYEVSIYCDGACEPNPGNAGSGVIVYREGVLSELWYGLYNPQGTNNTAELNALHEALRMAEAAIKDGYGVEICSDSQYAINCISKWAPGWEKKGWTKKDGEIKNLEIIQDGYAIYQRIKDEDLALTHVAAHVGTEGNELADRMAMYGALSKTRELKRYEETMDVVTLLKLRKG
ncbi:MAG: ribonuclease H family protein [Steroidobacteraceae bacterium]